VAGVSEELLGEEGGRPMNNKEVVRILTRCAVRDIDRIVGIEKDYGGNSGAWRKEKDQIKEAVRCLRVKFGISD